MCLNRCTLFIHTPRFFFPGLYSFSIALVDYIRELHDILTLNPLLSHSSLDS